MDDLEVIIESLGDQNELIDEDDLDDIEEEIDSIDKEEYFDLAKIAINLGKPQILEYLLEIYKFNDQEIEDLCGEISKFNKTQMKKAKEEGDSEDEKDIEEIMKEYTTIIKNFRKLPYKKDTHKKTSQRKF
jgi:hypothetical protein